MVYRGTMKKFHLKQVGRIISSKTKCTPCRILKGCCNELRARAVEEGEEPRFLKHVHRKRLQEASPRQIALNELWQLFLVKTWV